VAENKHVEKEGKEACRNKEKQHVEEGGKTMLCTCRKT
jgi:hypothetical protein